MRTRSATLSELQSQLEAARDHINRLSEDIHALHLEMENNEEFNSLDFNGDPHSVFLYQVHTSIVRFCQSVYKINSLLRNDQS